VDAEPRPVGWVDRCWLGFCLLASTLAIVTASARLSATWDEPTYLRNGLEAWRNFKMTPILGTGTMPLPVLVETLPLAVWRRCRGRAFDLSTELPQMLPLARAGSLPFWWLLLGAGWLLGRRLGGVRGGRFAAGLLAAEPTLLAHAGLATTDLSLTAALVALMACLVVRHEGGWRRRVGWPAFWTGIAILCKISAIVFAPLCLLAVEVSRRRPALGLRPLLRDGLQVGLLAVGLVAVVSVRDWRRSHDLIRAAERLPDGPFRGPLCRLAQAFRYPACFYPLQFQQKHNHEGHGSVCFRLGLGPEPYWFHFPLTLSMKCSAAVLLLGGLLLTRPRRLANVALLAAALLLLFSLTSRIQIGVRLVLPVVALLLIGLAVAWAGWLAEARRAWARGVLFGVAGVVFLGSATAAARTWPHHLCSVNEFWGGTATGYLYVSDSDYDWGQGLYDLERWRRRAGLDELDVWYFGWIDPPAADGLRRVALERLPVGPDGLRSVLAGRCLAASTTLVYGQGDCPAAVSLRGRRPVARTQTFLIYDFSTGEP
jgi:hypothetical protein